jgi:hypothetical protein
VQGNSYFIFVPDLTLVETHKEEVKAIIETLNSSLSTPSNSKIILFMNEAPVITVEAYNAEKGYLTRNIVTKPEAKQL